jgi:hypothetical protein
VYCVENLMHVDMRTWTIEEEPLELPAAIDQLLYSEEHEEVSISGVDALK